MFPGVPGVPKTFHGRIPVFSVLLLQMTVSSIDAKMLFSILS